MSSVSSKPDSKRPAERAARQGQEGWNPAVALALVLIGFALLPRAAELLLAAVPALLLHWGTAQINLWFDTPAANFLYVLLAEGMTVGVLFWFIRRHKQVFAKVVGLARQPQWIDLGYVIGGVVMYVVLFVVAVSLLDHITHINTQQEQAIGFQRGIHGSGLVLAFVSLVILPPVAEEVIFRGFFYGTLRRHKLSIAWSTFITSLLFGALHLFGGAGGGLLWIAGVDTFVLSVVLCYAREQTGNVWASMGIHALKNGFVFLNLFVFSIS